MTAEEMAKRYQPKDLKTFEYERQLWEARFSPCGKFVVACGYDATLQRWRVTDEALEPLPAFKGHNGWVQCLDFITEGERVIAADSWGAVSCWKYSEAEAAKPLWTRADVLSGWVRALDVSPDGSQVAVAGNDRHVRILATADGRTLNEFPVTDEVFSVVFHPDGKQLVAGDLKAVVRSWNIETGAVTREVTIPDFYKLNHQQECGGARRLCFDASGKRLAVGGQKAPDGGFAKGTPAVAVIDWESGKVTHQVLAGGDQDGFIYDLTFHPDGFLMGTASAFPGQGKLFFWKPEDEKPFYMAPKHTNGRSISLHSDKRRLLFLMSVSSNGNGRALGKNGEYFGGNAKLFLLGFPETAA